MSKLILNDVTCTELEAKLAEAGLSPKAAPRILARVHARGASAEAVLAVQDGLPKRERAFLATAAGPAARLTVAARQHSPHDNFRKFLFALEGGAAVEAVAIPLPAGPSVQPEHYVVCVSSQAGCALACAFCATGRLGFRRQLAAWEMVEQVARIRDDLEAPVRGVVFMGMGEPLLNYEAVMRAADILSLPSGFAIARKAMTISTAGIVPGIRRFAAERRPQRLAVSLTSAIDHKRQELMPITRTYPIADLLLAMREYCTSAKERIVVEYVMCGGVNVGQEDADALIERLRGLPVRLNLIDVNDTTGRFTPPSDDERQRFRDWLAPLKQPIVRRYSGGKDIAAACGMLAAGEQR